jgi:Flp pilus assembly protein TadD
MSTLKYIRNFKLRMLVPLGAILLLFSGAIGNTGQFYQTKSAAVYEDDSEELRRQAFVFLQAGNWTEATKIFTKILETEPREPLTLYGNSLALFNLRQTEPAELNVLTAIDVLEKDGASNPLLADCFVLSAVISATKKNNEEAVLKLQKAIKIVPNHFDANFSLGRAYFGNNDLDNALMFFRRAVEIQPQNFRANFFLATTAERAGNSDEALKTYREILRLYPNSSDGNLGLGVLLLKTAGEKSEEGLKALQKSVALNPNQYEARVVLGKTLITLNRFSEAVDNLQKAGELAPENPESYYQLAIAYRKSGKKTEADEVLQKVKKIHASRRNTTVKN